MPGGAVEARFVAGVHVFARAPAPLLSAGDELEFDDTFGAKSDGDFAIESLRGRWHEDAAALFYGGEDFWAMDYLVGMRGADFFLAFGYKDRIDRGLSPCACNCVHCAVASGFGAFFLS